MLLLTIYPTFRAFNILNSIYILSTASHLSEMDSHYSYPDFSIMYSNRKGRCVGRVGLIDSNGFMRHTMKITSQVKAVGIPVLPRSVKKGIRS